MVRKARVHISSSWWFDVLYPSRGLSSFGLAQHLMFVLCNPFQAFSMKYALVYAIEAACGSVLVGGLAGLSMLGADGRWYRRIALYRKITVAL